jgi:signal transduction histidine kinase
VGPTVSVRRHIASLDRLSPGIEATAYFVVSEALANVVKHAQATAATITIDRAGGRLRVQVTDDGTGGAAAVPGGGLSGLTDRVAAVAGSLTIADQPVGGTSVVADLPYIPRPGSRHA